MNHASASAAEVRVSAAASIGVSLVNASDRPDIASLLYSLVMSELPPKGSPERTEIDEIAGRLEEAGYELSLTNEVDETWYAALLRRGVAGPASAPFAAGHSAVEAARNAWTLYVSTPSLSSFKTSLPA
jgi:hypothetical protein